MKTHSKIVLLGLVFALSALFFWAAINQYILPSKAQLASNVQIVPHATSIECNPKGECYLHVLASTDVKNGVSGLSGKVQYSENLETVRLDSVGTCKTASFGLDQYFQFQDDKATKTVTFTTSTVRNTQELMGGNGCLVTLVFKPVNVTTDPQQAKLMFTDSANWKVPGAIGGAVGVLTPQVDTSSIAVKITSTAPWPPVDQPAPTGGTAACQKSKGDCNCDSKVDMLDWEIIRSYYQSEGKTCDMDSDGKADKEYSIWMFNNSFLRPIEY